MNVKLAVVGDFNPANSSHIATNDAIAHCAAAVGATVEHRWIGTEKLDGAAAAEQLAGFDGMWIAPASPYCSMTGALSAIRLGRERGIPVLGTCGGFQHIVLEYARNVLGFVEASHEETDPNASCLFISRLECSLVGRRLDITVEPDSLVGRLYGRTMVHEGYYCNFGVNPRYAEALRSGGLRIVASDAEGEVRAVELAGHPFFVGTLFLPQHNSSATAPHPLIVGFLKACVPEEVAS